jgi:NAD(P)-dependent dehydrogenase (short-subunit alcohol dehydrogenase family)
MTNRQLGSRSTAEQALRGASLRGKRAIVTGANSGLGAETVRVLAMAGANVIMGCRNAATGEEVATGLRAKLGADAGTLTVQPLDLSDLRFVDAFTEEERRRGEPLDLLINNAGVMATPLGRTAQGIELQLGTNHVGHFRLTLGLLPLLEAAPSARIVTVSSALHGRGRAERLVETLESDPRYERRAYSRFDAYGDSKLANVLFTRALARRLPASVATFSLHPGVIPTPLSRNMGVGGALFRVFGRPFMKSIPQGAATQVFAATASELEGESGAYLSDCAIDRPSRDALDDDLGRRVWKLTEEHVARA